MKAVVLHSISDLADSVAKGLHEDNFFFSTHPSVDVYAKEVYGIECNCLSNYLTVHDIQKNYSMVSSKVDKILFDLDSRIAPELNSLLACEMMYFNPLYSYIGKHHLLAYYCFYHALRKMKEVYKLSDLLFYHMKDTSLFKNIRIGNLIEHLSFAHHDTVESKPVDIEKHYALQDRLKYVYSMLQVAPLRFMKILLNKMMRNFGEVSKINGKKKTIMIYKPLYDLSFIIDDLKEYNTIYFDADGFSVSYDTLETPFAQKWNVDNLGILENNDDIITDVFLKDILNDFNGKITQYIQNIRHLKEIDKHVGISLGLWGNPPIMGSTALAFEYLRKKGVKTIGFQHGACYGDQIVPKHIDSDYNRCDFFVSYGFTKEDLKCGYREHHDIRFRTRVMPYGQLTKTKKIPWHRKHIDFLFPITNCISIFDGGVSRNPFLAKAQIDMLEYLNTKQNLTIVVKPMIFSTYKNFGMFPLLSSLKNLTVVNYMGLRDFLVKYMPKAVIIEYPSTTLYDVIGMDTEIFLLGDPINVYEDGALEKLKKRVYYAENTAQLFTMIDRFIDGKLEIKRDNTFYNHYVNKDNAQNNVLTLIDNLITRGVAN